MACAQVPIRTPTYAQREWHQARTTCMRMGSHSIHPCSMSAHTAVCLAVCLCAGWCFDAGLVLGACLRSANAVHREGEGERDSDLGPVVTHALKRSGAWMGMLGCAAGRKRHQQRLRRGRASLPNRSGLRLTALLCFKPRVCVRCRHRQHGNQHPPAAATEAPIRPRLCPAC